MRQSFERRSGRILRRVSLGAEFFETDLEDRSDAGLEGAAAWWQSVLRGAAVGPRSEIKPVRIVDAFCGSGGLGLGARLALEAVGRKAEFAAIVDTDVDAVAIHRHNLGARKHITASAASLVDYHVLGVGPEATFGYAPEVVNADLAKVSSVDLFIAGPPCQGNSNLNNHTRRNDPRNDLYVTAVALAIALAAEVVVIENVPTVLNSHSDVVTTAAGLLRSVGYGVTMATLRADQLGAAQRRARHFLVAVRGRLLREDHLSTVAGYLQAPAMPVSWSIGDLLEHEPKGIFDTAPALTPVNARRVEFLFAHDLHDLPNSERPECHRNGTSYTAVYGRMHWDKPAQTITTGFGTPGQGRYIHPKKMRVITPHEAARIQGFPDWFDFAPRDFPLKRKHLAKWIGDAVHPMLGYVVTLSGLAALSEASTIGLRAA